MILENMTNDEILNEIKKDYQIMNSKYLDRFNRAYDKWRRKKPRLKREELPKSYSFETSSKNKWIVILSKPPADNKYKGISSISFCLLCYYYTNLGIRVFKVDAPKGIRAFNGHFFSKYNESLKLGLTNPVDQVIHYFSNNSFCVDSLSPNGNGYNVIGKCKDGFRIGDRQDGDYWTVYKDFVSNDLLTEELHEFGDSLMAALQKTIEDEINKEEFDHNSYSYHADIFKGIKSNKNRA
jgi:hypothetical protein